MGALRGLVYFKSICVDVPFKINVGAFSNEQQLHTKKMVGWDDDASHSQVICPSEDSE